MKPSRYGRRYKTQLNTCLTCAVPFHPRLGRRNQKYCTQQCDKLAKSAARVDKVCPKCLKTFSVNKSIADRYSVCSVQCRYVDTKHQACERCGKGFTAERHLNRRFCSESCRRPIQLIECANCSKPFRVGPSENRRFCCFSCYRRFNGVSSLEVAMRHALTELEIQFAQEVPIGRYSVDFQVVGSKIAIEVDGNYWHDQVRDARRDSTLAKYGWTTIRFSEDEVTNSPNLMALVRARLSQVDVKENTPALDM